jgi:hypothetical protein
MVSKNLMYEIPANPSLINDTAQSCFEETISIDNIYYKLRFQWNSRDTCWLLNISDVNDSPIICGIKLVINYELIRQYAASIMPSGYLFLLDLSGTNAPCDFGSLGSRCKLYYIENS